MTPDAGSSIAEYSPIEAVLADLTKRHKGVVFDVTVPAQMQAAKAAAKDIAQYRIALEKKRTDLKADVLVRGRLIDGEAKRISVQLAELEDPIVDQIKAEERRVEAERQAAVEAETRRLEEEARKKKEAEDAELARQRAEIASQQAAIKAEQDRLQEEDRKRRKALADEEDAARRRIEEETRAAAAAREEGDRKAAEARRALEDRLAAERAEIEAKRRKLEDDAREEQFRKDEEARAIRLKEQLAREAAENAKAEAEREARRQAAEQLDARHMLELWFEKYGHLQQFKTVAGAIGVFLTKPKAKRAA